MKIKHLLALAAIAVIGGGSANAQIVAGDYFIQNVESGMFLNGANDWGTKASVTKHGQKMTIAVSGSGYTIDSHISNGGDSHFLAAGDNTYSDGAASAHTITTLSDGIYSIMDTNNKYLVQNDGTKVNFAADNADANTAKWKFITMDDVATLMGTATVENPVDATYYIGDANFSRNNQYYSNWIWAWGQSNNKQNHNKAGNNDNNVVESYHAQFSLTQTMTVPNGVYAVTAQGFYRQDGSDNGNLPYFFANDKTVNVPAKTGAENSMANASTSFSSGLYTIDPIYVQVTDGTLNIGVSNMNNDALWVIFDNFEMKYYGDVTLADVLLSEYVKAYNEAMTEAQSYTTLTLYGATASSDLATAISNNTVTLATATQEQLETATANLKAAIAAAKAARALQVSKEAAEDAIAGGEGTDISSVLVNADFQTSDLTGWTSVDGGNVANNGNFNSTIFAERWINSSSKTGLGNGSLTHDPIVLPAGFYTLKVDAQNIEQYNSNAAGKGLFLRAAGEEVEIGAKDTYSMLVKLNEETVVTVAIVLENCTGNWVAYDNFKIIYEGEDFPPLPDAAEGKMNAEVAAAQTAAIEAFNADATVANYKAALAAIAVAKTSVETYSTVAGYLTTANEILNSTNVYTAEARSAYEEAISGFQTKYDNCTLTDSEKNTAKTNLTGPADYNKPKNVMTTYIASAWTATNGVSIYTNDWSWEGGQDGNSGLTTPFIENWVAEAQKLANTEVSATMTELTNGLYRFTADVRLMNSKTGDDAGFDGITFFANNVAPSMPEATTYPDGNLYQISIEAVVKDGTLKLGYTVNNTNVSWVAMKNVMYTMVRELNDDDLEAIAKEEALASANEVKTAWAGKVGGVFQHTAETYDALVAIIDNAEATSTQINDAVSAFNNSKVEPDANKYYRLYLVADGESTELNLNAFYGINKQLTISSTPYAVKIVPVNDGYNVRDVYGNNIVHAKNNASVWGTANADWESLGGSRGERITAALNDNGTVTLTSAYASIALGANGFTDGSSVGRNANTQWLVSEPVEITEAAMAVNSEAKYGTFCAPYDVLVPADVTASTATIGENGGTIELASVENNIIPANTPVVLYAENGLDKVTMKGISVAGTPEAGCLTGTYERIYAPEGSYILQNNEKVGFYLCDVDNKFVVAKNRCYLTTTQAQAREAYFFEGDETAIDVIDALTSGKAEIYDLSGRKLNNLQKGINIINGKKVMVK